MAFWGVSFGVVGTLWMYKNMVLGGYIPAIYRGLTKINSSIFRCEQELSGCWSASFSNTFLPTFTAATAASSNQTSNSAAGRHIIRLLSAPAILQAIDNLRS